MALHACPGCTMIQDIYVAEVKPYFSICLSRDFTTQIGGFISVDWSYMSVDAQKWFASTRSSLLHTNSSHFLILLTLIFWPN